jgi:gliding motility-associated lipoprotein GldD
MPKPYGYFRIDLPVKTYHKWNQGYPYTFEIPGYSEVITDKNANSEPYWINVEVPCNKAEIHISYKKVDNNLFVFTEESRKLAYDHTIKASSIEEEIFLNPAKRVFGTIYHINGNAASPMQFYLTDSLCHFLRGSLYICATPNIDSLKPVIDFLKTDVTRLIETTEWTETENNGK